MTLAFLVTQILAGSGGGNGGLNLGQTKVQDASGALPYLVVAYGLFFLVIFAYVLLISRRQSQLHGDIVLLRRALDEENALAGES